MNTPTPSLQEDTLSQIRNFLEQHRVVLFMKGEAHAPQCGFSAASVQVLQLLGVEFVSVNVLLNNEIREGIKQHARWPTIPQLYIDSEFIGGCDIIREMFEDGSLMKMVEEKDLPLAT